ncbi:Uncharacterised protein [Serratia marcescens]|nr:Uncharacterised protein [Serratia marcescens]CVE12479.1 Uncharacterised protein [Serratia marcescens]
MLVGGADLVDLRRQAIQAEVAFDDALRQRAGVQIRRLLDDRHFMQQERRQDRPAQPQARRQDLGEGRGINDVVGVAQHPLRHLMQRRVALFGETQLAVRIVFDDQEVMFSGQFHQQFAARGAQGDAAGVAEVRHHVHALDALGFQQLGQLFHHHAVAVGRDRHDVGLRQLQRLQRRQVGRALHHEHVAGVDDGAHHQIQCLLRAGGDHHLFRTSGDAALGAQRANALTQQRAALGQAILERAFRLFGDRLLGGDAQSFEIEQRIRGDAARQRNDVFHLAVFKQFTDGRTFYVNDALRE